MEFVIALSRLFLYFLLVVNCLQHAVSLPHSLDKTEIVTEALAARRTMESELTTTAVTESVSLKIQSTELDSTHVESNKETTQVIAEDSNNKNVVSTTTTTPIDLSDLLMGTDPRIRHSNSARSNDRRKVRRTPPKIKKIYSKWQLFLSIDKDGRVYGTDSNNDDNTIFEIKQVPSMNSLVILKGKASALFVCINSTGHLYGRKVPIGECFFQENIYRNDGWTSFSSCEYPSSSKHSLCRSNRRKKGWMVALNKDGSPRNAETAWSTKKRSRPTRFLKTDVPTKTSESR